MVAALDVSLGEDVAPARASDGGATRLDSLFRGVVCSVALVGADLVVVAPESACSVRVPPERLLRPCPERRLDRVAPLRAEEREKEVVSLSPSARTNAGRLSATDVTPLARAGSSSCAETRALSSRSARRRSMRASSATLRRAHAVPRSSSASTLSGRPERTREHRATTRSGRPAARARARRLSVSKARRRWASGNSCGPGEQRSAIAAPGKASKRHRRELRTFPPTESTNSNHLIPPYPGDTAGKAGLYREAAGNHERIFNYTLTAPGFGEVLHFVLKGRGAVWGSVPAEACGDRW